MSQIVECFSQSEEDQAFATGALMVIRVDLLPTVAPPPQQPACEDLTSYIEVDPAGVIATTVDTISFSSLTRSMSAYVYKDYGANHFYGDCAIDFEYMVTECSTTMPNFNAGFISFCNDISDRQAIVDGLGCIQGLLTGNNGSARFLCLNELVDGIPYNSAMFSPALNTNYYCTFSRDMNAGAYGNLALKIYADQARTSLLNTLSLVLHAAVSFRYLYMLQSVNSGHSSHMSGTIRNVVINP